MRSFLPAATCVALFLAACEATGQPDDARGGSYGSASGDAGASSTSHSNEPPSAPRASAAPVAIAAESSSAAQATRKHPQPTLRLPNPPFASTAVAQFNQPWAMVFLPDGR